MFTGLVLDRASLFRKRVYGVDVQLSFRFAVSISDLEMGESIAVNGVCLTVDSFGADWFSAFVSAETLSCTSLGTLSLGNFVNIERALRLCDRLGGHMVTGHVDVLGEVRSIVDDGRSVCIGVSLPSEYAFQVVEKGSVALDGISLTVNSVGADFFSVNCIPHTVKVTTIDTWRVGTKVNIETDIFGKYVLRYLQGGGNLHTKGDGASPALSMDFLKENGFL